MEFDFAPSPPYVPFRVVIFGADVGGFNMGTIIMTWVVIGIMTLACLLILRKIRRVPTKLQLLLEFIVDAFDNLTRSTLGKRGRTYMPYIGSLFLFIWLSNIIGVIPTLEEPTRDLNTPLALAFFVAIPVAHISAMRVKGVKTYVKDYFEPAFRIRGVWLPNVLMFPLNFIGEVGKSISLPFRLFGNIFGGAIILTVLCGLIMYVGLPPFMLFFFGLFAGTIQAFVFSMLALTYTAVAIAE
jgi:F-type H+-transporting ATPase subunit a